MHWKIHRENGRFFLETPEGAKHEVTVADLHHMARIAAEVLESENKGLKNEIAERAEEGLDRRF